MAFDAFAYFPSDEDLKGETSDHEYAAKGAFELISFEIGAENTINIGSMTKGGGAGKATFNPLTITKKTDTASCGLFANLCAGHHFDDLVVDLRRSGGSPGLSGVVFLKFEFKLVMVENMSWSGSDGDDVCEESLTLQYGAMKVTYKQQGIDGMMGEPTNAEWSRILNQANFSV